LQKKNTQLHEEMIEMLKSTARHQQWLSKPVEEEDYEDPQVKKRYSNTPKPLRPIIEEGVDDFGWRLFLDKWSRFKTMAKLEDAAEICLNLRESCSPDINRLLFQYVGEGSLNNPNLSEEELLESIKSVAVRSIHTEVHRWHFNQLEQQDSEPATKFVGRLKAQAALCNFTVECRCGTSVSYDEEMVSQRLTSGIQNPEHQRKVLGEADKLDTLKKKVDKLINLETTDDATDKIRAPPTRALHLLEPTHSTGRIRSKLWSAVIREVGPPKEDSQQLVKKGDAEVVADTAMAKENPSSGKTVPHLDRSATHARKKTTSPKYA